jgi:hypothetical protein
MIPTRYARRQTIPIASPPPSNRRRVSFSRSPSRCTVRGTLGSSIGDMRQMLLFLLLVHCALCVRNFFDDEMSDAIGQRTHRFFSVTVTTRHFRLSVQSCVLQSVFDDRRVEVAVVSQLLLRQS